MGVRIFSETIQAANTTLQLLPAVSNLVLKERPAANLNIAYTLMR